MPNGGYIEKVHNNLVQSGGGSFTLPLEEFTERMQTNPEYVQRVHANLTESGAGTFTLSLDEFQNRVGGDQKKKEKTIPTPLLPPQPPEFTEALPLELPKAVQDETIVSDQPLVPQVEIEKQQTEGFKTIDEFSRAEKASQQRFEKAKKVVKEVGADHPDAFVRPAVVEEFKQKLLDKDYTEEQANELTDIMLRSAERKYGDREVSRIKSLINTRSGYTPQQANQILFSASDEKMDEFKDYLLQRGYNIRDIDRAIREKQLAFLQRQGKNLEQEFIDESEEKGMNEEQIASRMIGIGTSYLSPQLRSIAQNNVEYQQLINTLKNPEKPLNELERYDIRVRMGEIERERAVTDLQDLYDPATGRYVAKDQASDEAIQYERTVTQEIQKLTTDQEELARIWQDKYFQFKFIEDLYKGEYFSARTRGGGPERTMSAEELSSIASQLGFGTVSDPRAEQEALALKDKYLDARSKFEAVNRAYLLNEDPAAVDRGFLNHLKIAGAAALEQVGLKELVPETDQKFVEGYVEAVREEGGKITEAQKQRYEKDLSEKIAEGVGASIPIMAEIAATSVLTEGIAAAPRIAQAGKKLKDFLSGKYGKVGELGYNLFESGVKGYAAFAPTQEEGITGVGEGFAQGVVNTINPERFLRGKYGKVANLLFRTAVGTPAETAAEFTGDYLKNLDDNGYDYKEAFRETFGRDLEDFSDRLAVVGLTSALFSGTFNLATMKWANEQLAQQEQTEEVKQAREVLEDRIKAGTTVELEVEQPDAKPAYEVGKEKVSKAEIEKKIEDPAFIEQVKKGETDIKVENDPELEEKLRSALGEEPTKEVKQEEEITVEPKTKPDDSKDIEGVPGQERVGEAVEQRQPEQRTGEETPEAGRVLQAQEGQEEKVTPQEKPAEPEKVSPDRRVEFKFYDGTIKRGKVMRIEGEKIKIKGDDGKNYSMEEGDIIKDVSADPKKEVKDLINELTAKGKEKAFEKVEARGFSLNPFIRKVRKNQSNLRDEIKFDDSEVEARFQQAGQITKSDSNIFKRAIDKTKALVTGFRRKYRPLDPKKYAREANKLRVFEDLSRYTQSKANQYMKSIVESLTPEQFEIMKRRIILEDLVSGIDAGIESETALPFDLKSKEQAQEYVDKMTALMEKEPAAKEAYEARQFFMKKLHDDLVKNKLIADKPGGYSAYYHRRTLEYMQDELNQRVLAGKRLTKAQRNFMKARSGSKGKDYSTNFLESEYKVVADAIYELEKLRFLEELMAPFEKELDALKKKANEAFEKEYGDITAKFEEGSEEAKAAKRLKKDFVADYIETNKPEDYEFFQPDPGNNLFRQSMVTERLIEDAMEELQLAGDPNTGNMLDGMERLLEEARDFVVLGGKKKQFLIPKGLAGAIEQIGAAKTPQGLRDEALKLAEYLTRNWKIFVLLNPARALKYNLNNAMGDLDGLLAADPTILKKVRKATIDVIDFARTGKVDATFDKALEQGVLDSGFDIKELAEINKLGWAKHFLTNNGTIENYLGKSAIRKGLTSKNPGKWYFNWIKNITSARENAFRYAAFVRALEKIDAGETFYWASDPKQIDQITDKYEKAGKLAREALGDYGNISQSGQHLRKHLLPFYSWMEVNTKRYLNLLKNASDPQTQAKILGIAAKRGVTKVAAKMLQRYLQLVVFTSLAHLWNKGMYALFDIFDPEGAKQLKKHRLTETRGLQLIMGVGEDGKPRTLPIIGAFYDFLDWAAIPDIAEELVDLYSGEQTPEKAKNNISEDLINGPINKITQGFNPFLKSAAELMMGKTIYPNWRSPRPIKDEYEYIARFFSLGKTYNYLFDKPTREPAADLHWITDLFVRKFDPEEAAYFEVKNFIGKEKGFGTSGTARSEPVRKRREALYNWAKATRYGQNAQAEKWLEKYYEAGGTRRGLKTSISNKNPLHQLDKKEKKDVRLRVLKGKTPKTEFGKQLSKREIELIKVALEYYEKTFKGR